MAKLPTSVICLPMARKSLCSCTAWWQICRNSCKPATCECRLALFSSHLCHTRTLAAAALGGRFEGIRANLPLATAALALYSRYLCWARALAASPLGGRFAGIRANLPLAVSVAWFSGPGSYVSQESLPLRLWVADLKEFVQTCHLLAQPELSAPATYIRQEPLQLPHLVADLHEFVQTCHPDNI